MLEDTVLLGSLPVKPSSITARQSDRPEVTRYKATQAVRTLANKSSLSTISIMIRPASSSCHTRDPPWKLCATSVAYNDCHDQVGSSLCTLTTLSRASPTHRGFPSRISVLRMLSRCGSKSHKVILRRLTDTAAPKLTRIGVKVSLRATHSATVRVSSSTVSKGNVPS